MVLDVLNKVIKTNDGEIVPNCRKEVRDGVTFLICEPVMKKGDIKIPLTEREVVFRIVATPRGAVADMIDDGMSDEKVLEAIDRRLQKYAKYVLKPSVDEIKIKKGGEK